jgi:hypothetical protein
VLDSGLKSTTRITIVICLALFVFPAFVGPSVVNSPFHISSAATTKGPVFVWMFGYIGDTFWPLANQSITPQQTISLAANLSAKVGAANLRLVNPVDVEQLHNVHPQMIPTVKAYVDSLKQYASVLYGRIDLLQFNTTSKLYPEISMFVTQLDLNGVFFDYAPVLYNRIGQTAFNQMIQNLSDSFPGLNYVMNEAAKSNNYITPLVGTTWGANTYVMPTVSGTYTFSGVSLSRVAALNKIYSGRVLLHYDANAELKGATMCIFASQTASNEISALRTLAYRGAHPTSSQYAYRFLYPVLGAWTYEGGQYRGTLYNSLTIGTYNRSTISAFTSIMVRNDV